tara:strand:+ start:513 stop:707 length:195 start_codon:yes stop_codon:yes gene_type:complete
MIAISSGLAKGFDLAYIPPSGPVPATLGELLEEIPEDSPMWQTFDSLFKKRRGIKLTVKVSNGS